MHEVFNKKFQREINWPEWQKMTKKWCKPQTGPNAYTHSVKWIERSNRCTERIKYKRYHVDRIIQKGSKLFIPSYHEDDHLGANRNWTTNCVYVEP